MKFFLIISLVLLSSCSPKPETNLSEENANSPSIVAAKEEVSENKQTEKSTDHKEDAKKQKANILSLSPAATKSGTIPHKILVKRCIEDMNKLSGRGSKNIETLCEQVTQLDGCYSENGIPIYHFNRKSDNPKAKRILTFALIHGDEGPSGTVAHAWMERLSHIDPRNAWRVIPVLNPDGWKLNTRMNVHGIDINRNFPTQNWDTESKKRWKSKKFDPRRFPGKIAGSEQETKCAMKHIEDFDPSFIISIHTPYGVLDFDGPPMKFPQFEPLPWFSLGNYPGSLGRYMWAERRVPVLTIELKGNNVADKLEEFDRLQDITGIVAIQAEKVIKKKEKKRKASEAVKEAARSQDQSIIDKQHKADAKHVAKTSKE